MVLMKPTSSPKASWRTLAIGATQLVVHEAFDRMFWLPSYDASLMPITTVRSSPLAGAEMTTFLAPALRCFPAESASVKMPDDSMTTSTPRSPHGSDAGSFSA